MSVEAPAAPAVQSDTTSSRAVSATPALLAEQAGSPSGDGFNLVGNAFDEIEKGLGLEPTPEPVKKDKPKEVAQEPEPEAQPSEEATEEQETAPETTEAEETQETEEAPAGPQTPKAKMKWGELKGKAKELDRIKPEYDALKKEVEALKSGSAGEVGELKQKLELLQKEQEEVQGELYVSRVQATKEYKRAVIEPLENIIKYAEEIAKSNNLDPNELINHLQSGNRAKLNEIAENLPALDRGEIATMHSDLRVIEQRRQDLETNARQAWETAQERETGEVTKRQQQVLETRQAEYKRMLPAFEKLLADVPEADRPNLAQLETAIAGMDGMEESLKVFGMVAATATPALMKQNQSLKAEVAALKKEASALRNGAPRANNGVTPSAEKTKKPEEDPKNSEGLAGDIVAKMKALGIAM